MGEPNQELLTRHGLKDVTGQVELPQRQKAVIRPPFVAVEEYISALEQLNPTVQREDLYTEETRFISRKRRLDEIKKLSVPAVRSFFLEREKVLNSQSRKEIDDLVDFHVGFFQPRSYKKF